MLRSDRRVCTLKSTPTLIFIKTVFDVEKCLASLQGLSRHTHFLLSEYCRFFKCKLFLRLSVLNYDDWGYFMLLTIIRSRLQGRELKPFSCVQVQDLLLHL